MKILPVDSEMPRLISAAACLCCELLFPVWVCACSEGRCSAAGRQTALFAFPARHKMLLVNHKTCALHCMMFIHELHKR